jgi:HEAT repeat protein
MNRAALLAATILCCALPLAAQNPAPTAPAPKAKPGVAPRAKTPRPPRTPAEWPMIDMGDMEWKLDALRDLDLNVPMPPMPPMPVMPDMADMEFELAPLANMDMDFDLVGGPMIAPHFHEFEFDFEMPDFSEMPGFPETPDFIDMPDFPDIPDVPEIPPIPSLPPVAMVPMTPMAPMVAAPPMPAVVAFPPGPPTIAATPNIGWRSQFDQQFSGITSNPPESFAQADPADSLYRLARTALNRGEYRRAADLFGEISQKYPSSAYASDARYWRAFALYRLGGRDDLRTALVALQDTGRGFRQPSLQTDAPVLAARIRGALARDGDESARQQLTVTAGQTSACDREDLAVRVEALNSLGQTDPESTTPILRRLLARRDDCSATLRRAALYLLGRRTDDEARDLVMSAARNDPDIRVRADALRFLAAMPGDQPVATIEEMARTPGNEELQRAAVAALGRSDSPRARQSLRNIIERTDLSESLRTTALSSVDADHVADNGAYIRSVYPKLDTPRLKAAAIRSLARIGGSDNDQFLLGVVRNQNESSEVRAMALRMAGRSSIPIADLAKMYDVAGDRQLREQLIALYARRDEPEATDKLLEIARSGTDPDMRRYAISALSRKNDPRTKKLLLEIIDK